MTFVEKLNLIERLDQLVRMQATGSPNELANRISVSRRCLFDVINLMKSMNAPIKFSNSRQSYYYEYECCFSFGFVNTKKNIGDLNIK